MFGNILITFGKGYAPIHICAAALQEVLSSKPRVR
jgi:hypothetical protein